MRRKYKEIDPNEFAAADDMGKTTTIKGEMRKLYVEINRKLKEGGWSAKDVVAWFNEREMAISVELFRVYLRDLDREHGYKRSTNEYLNPQTKPVGKATQKIIQHPTDSSKVIGREPSTAPTVSESGKDSQTDSKKISNPSDLKKARDKEVNLDDYND